LIDTLLKRKKEDEVKLFVFEPICFAPLFHPIFIDLFIASPIHCAHLWISKNPGKAEILQGTVFLSLLASGSCSCRDGNGSFVKLLSAMR